MKKVMLWFLIIAVFTVCGQTVQSKAEEKTIDIWTAASTGNLEAIKAMKIDETKGLYK